VYTLVCQKVTGQGHRRSN